MDGAYSFRAGGRKIVWLLSGLLCASPLAPAQLPEPAPAPLNESGQVIVAGRSTPFLIRHLPLSAFPDLPVPLEELLDRRGCLIPQTYQAHRPENVIHASLERAGSSDWPSSARPMEPSPCWSFFERPGSTAGARRRARIRAAPTHDPSGVLGFNWGIDPASPDQVRQARSAWSAARPAWTTTPSPTPSSTATPSTTSI